MNRIILLTLSVLLLWGVVGSAATPAEDSEYSEFKLLRAMHDQGIQMNNPDKVRFSELADRYLIPSRDRHLDDRGGPDAYGYEFVDNMNGDSATYDWIELRGDGNAIWPTFNSPDDGAVTIPLSFAFPFYGATYNEIRINSNGFIEFATTVGGHSNHCLPAAGVEGPAVFGFWDDLHMSYGGNGENVDNTIAYRDFLDYMVVEFCSTGHYDFPNAPDDSYKFEMILYASGKIKFQYSNMSFVNFSQTLTIGIQADETGPSLQYVCDTEGMQPENGMAIWFFTPPTGLVSGFVRDQMGSGLSYAAITILEADQTATSDGTGEYFFPTAPVGVWDLTAALFSYESATVQNVTITETEDVQVDFELQALPSVMYSSTHSPMAVLDQDTVRATLHCNSAVDIDEVGVRIHSLEHSYVSDLGIWLESPWGQRVALTFRHGGAGDNFMNTQFDDLAGTPIEFGSAPYTGRFIPEEPLNSFAGNVSWGTWTLILYDHAVLDEGMLNSWSVIFVGESSIQGVLDGTVTSYDTGEPLAGVMVSVPDAGTTATTNADGYYSMLMSPGAWDVYFDHDGYCSYTAENVAIEGGSITSVASEMWISDAEADVEEITHESVSGQISMSSFEWWNTGPCDLEWSMSTTSSGWLSVSPEEGVLSDGETQVITVTYDATEVGVGEYQGQIEVVTSGLNSSWMIDVTLDLASDAGDSPDVPASFALHGNYPNPFNSTTTIRYDVPDIAHVNLVVYNMLGQEVRTLRSGTVEAGRHSIFWNGKDNHGADLSSGLYLVRLDAPRFESTMKSILIR